MTNTTITVPFHGTELYVVSLNNEPYIPMKPIVEGMGMDWASQFTKMKNRFKSCIVKITMQLPGDTQSRDVICLAFRKLAAWLNTISPNKVRPEIRERVIQYQNECDDVLYEYWTTGEVKRKSTTTDERTPLRDAVNMLVGKKGLMYPEAYSLVHQRFNVGHIDELVAEQIPLAVEYIHRIVLEGELFEKDDTAVAIPLLPFNCEILARIENGVTVSTQLIPQDWYVGSVADFIQFMARRGIVILKDVEEQREFVRAYALSRL